MQQYIDKLDNFLKKPNSRLIQFMWAGFVSIVLIIAVIFLSIDYKSLPSFEALENPKNKEASIIYDSKLRVLGKYYVENREAVDFPDLNPHIVHALLATEDARFYSHSGIDFLAVMRVGVKTLAFGDRSSGGGSTITQQLAKLLFDRPSLKGMGKFEKMMTLIGVKLKEWVTALKLERSYTKEEIMTLYLNTFEFINGAHGIQAAAQTYFNKNQDLLDVHEAALLVGMLKNPSYFNPLRFEDRAKGRRNVVLGLMKSDGYISRSTRDSLQNLPLDMESFNRDEQTEGPAPYFRFELTKWLRKLIVDKDIRREDGKLYNIYSDGLKIYTTIDLDYQKLAEQAAREHMKKLQKTYFRVWKGMDPWTYQADEYQREIRQDILMIRLKSSARFQPYYEKYVSKSMAAITQKFPDLQLGEWVIRSIIYQEKQNQKPKPKTNPDEETPSLPIERIKLDRYKDLLASPEWAQLKADYAEMDKKFLEDMKKPTKMKVFDYEAGEIEVEMSPYDSVRFHNQHLQAGMLATDPKTGYIKAWVGGTDYKYFKYDHVNSRRSVGSTIKPFVYTAAMASTGIQPCQEFQDIQYSISPDDPNFAVDKEWAPANAEGYFTGEYYNLYRALLYSKNSVTVKLLKEMGSVELVRNLMDNLGLSKDLILPNGKQAVPAVPALCLGAIDVTLLDMTGAYTAFANNGTYTQPIFVTRIEDKNGKVLYSGAPQKKAAINPLYNAIMVDMLKTASGHMGLKTMAGGKTGTTNDYSDGWFMGITPNLVVGVWTGGDDKWIRFKDLNSGQGSVTAKPLFVKFIKLLEEDANLAFDTKAKFLNPPGGFADLVNCNKYKPTARSEETTKPMDNFDEEF